MPMCRGMRRCSPVSGSPPDRPNIRRRNTLASSNVLFAFSIVMVRPRGPRAVPGLRPRRASPVSEPRHWACHRRHGRDRSCGKARRGTISPDLAMSVHATASATAAAPAPAKHFLGSCVQDPLSYDVAFVRSGVSGPGNSTKRPGRRRLKRQAVFKVQRGPWLRPFHSEWWDRANLDAGALPSSSLSGHNLLLAAASALERWNARGTGEPCTPQLR